MTLVPGAPVVPSSVSAMAEEHVTLSLASVIATPGISGLHVINVSLFRFYNVIIYKAETFYWKSYNFDYYSIF